MSKQTIIQGDCIEIMKSMTDTFDLILTDPPYGDGTAYGRMDKEIANNEDESINYVALPEIYRLLTDGGVCYLFTNWKFAGKLLKFIEEETEFYPRAQIVIVKNNIGMGYGFRNQYELCLVLEKGKHKYENADFSNVQRMEHIPHDKDTHPHQKGILLLQRLIQHAGPPSKILDPFMGSGSTLVAAKELDIEAVGIELDENYCKIAEDRLAQDKLF